MAAHRKYRKLSDNELTALIEELRLGRYYRNKSICARYGISRIVLWKLEREYRNRQGEKE